MKKLILIFLILLIFFTVLQNSLPTTPSSGPTPSNFTSDVESKDVLRSFVQFMRSARDTFATYGDFNLSLLNLAWKVTPEDFKCFFGLFFIGVVFLVMIGLAVLRIGNGLWRNHGG